MDKFNSSYEKLTGPDDDNNFEKDVNLCDVHAPAVVIRKQQEIIDDCIDVPKSFPSFIDQRNSTTMNSVSAGPQNSSRNNLCNKASSRKLNSLFTHEPVFTYDHQTKNKSSNSSLNHSRQVDADYISSSDADFKSVEYLSIKDSIAWKSVSTAGDLWQSCNSELPPTLVPPRRNSTQSLPDLGDAYSFDELLSCNGTMGNSTESSSESVKIPEERHFSLWSSTREEKMILLCLSLIDLTSQMCLSIMAPFFPNEASSKGVSSTITGWIFGIFALVQFVTSPIFGKFLPHFGSRFLVTSGQFLAAGSFILFGLLDQVGSDEDNATFIALCFTVRVILALGCTASSTASFAITANSFPDNVSTVFGFLETATGLGLMVGPAVGGALYQSGGFRLPFFVIGSFMMLTVPLNFWCLKNYSDNQRPILPGEQRVTMFRLMCIPATIVVCCAVIMSALLWSITDPTLGPYLQTNFDMNSSVVGLLFLLMSAFYAAFSPIWGWIADKMSDSSPMIAVGFVFTGLGLLLLGSSKYIGLDPASPSVRVVIVALIILGISVSLALVPTFDKILDAVEKAGYQDSFLLYSYVASIWGACFALGDFLGPTLGGVMMDNISFDMIMSYTAIGCCGMAFLIAALILYERKCFNACSSKPTILYETLPGSTSNETNRSENMFGHSDQHSDPSDITTIDPSEITGLLQPSIQNAVTTSPHRARYMNLPLSRSLDSGLAAFA